MVKVIDNKEVVNVGNGSNAVIFNRKDIPELITKLLKIEDNKLESIGTVYLSK